MSGKRYANAARSYDKYAAHPPSRHWNSSSR
jgi:hypothetical protein